MTVATGGGSVAILERLACQRAGCDCRSALRRGHGRTHCPVHADPTPSLNVQDRGGLLLVKCHGGCSQTLVLEALRKQGLWPDRPPEHTNGSTRTMVAEYDYRDETGELLYQVVRFAPKRFQQRRPDGRGGWIWRLDDEDPDTGTKSHVTRRVLYRLPELLASDPAELTYVVEGEKDVDRARALGLVATSNVGGAGKWRSEYGDALRGRNVIVIPDNDEPGRNHARSVADMLRGVAASVRVLELPGLPDHGDLSDWLQDHTADELAALCSEATPAAVRSWPEPEDRGTATLSDQGAVEYVADLIRPGRITVWGAEEGTGKSFAVDGELGIRVAVAGGSFAGTWPIVQHGPVLVLSEMHADDDYEREAKVLAALELDRSALKDRYFRLSLMTAANGAPVMAEAAWRSFIVQWCRDHQVILMVFDTATGATQVEPWGREIQAVFRDLRLMLSDYPELAIILVVHLRKPTGHGDRRISDVLGEWGRWCDVVVLQERDGTSRTRLSSFKRVAHERRIVATKQDGLLVEPRDLTETSAKVPLEKVVSTIAANPGLTIAELASRLEVGKATAGRYVQEAIRAGQARSETGPRRTQVIFPAGALESTASPHHTASQVRDAVDDALPWNPPHHASPPYIGDAVGDAVHGPRCTIHRRPLSGAELELGECLDCMPLAAGAEGL